MSKNKNSKWLIQYGRLFLNNLSKNDNFQSNLTKIDIIGVLRSLNKNKMLKNRISKWLIQYGRFSGNNLNFAHINRKGFFDDTEKEYDIKK